MILKDVLKYMFLLSESETEEPEHELEVVRPSPGKIEPEVPIYLTVYYPGKGEVIGFFITCLPSCIIHSVKIY